MPTVLCGTKHAAYAGSGGIHGGLFGAFAAGTTAQVEKEKESGINE